VRRVDPGISTSTQQVGCAIGGHEGVLASVQSARGRRHAETLVPAIDVLRRQADIDSRRSLRGGRPRARVVHRLRVGIATAKAHGPRPAGADDRGDQPRPAGLPGALEPPPGGGGHRRPPGEVFTASYRQVPRRHPALGDFKVCSPDEPGADCWSHADDILLVGDGALRYADQFEDLTGAEVADQGLAYPSPASLVQLAHAQALREEFVKPWELQPLYLRAARRRINWATRDGAPAHRESDSAPSPRSCRGRRPSRGRGWGTRAATTA
jgi:tRNA threonylcarbamoyladenosine biosynthesis protein TsaB